MNTVRHYALTAASVLLVMVGLYASGQRAGRRAAELRIKSEELRALRESNDVQNKIDALPDDDVSRRLRDRWQR